MSEMKSYEIKWTPPLTSQQNAGRRRAIKAIFRRQADSRMRLLDQAIEILRNLSPDNRYHDAATRLVKEFYELDQDIMDAHIRILAKQLGRYPSPKEVYEDAP